MFSKQYTHYFLFSFRTFFFKKKKKKKPEHVGILAEIRGGCDPLNSYDISLYIYIYKFEF
jgi:hypothetical protein